MENKKNGHGKVMEKYFVKSVNAVRLVYYAKPILTTITRYCICIPMFPYILSSLSCGIVDNRYVCTLYIVMNVM